MTLVLRQTRFSFKVCHTDSNAQALLLRFRLTMRIAPAVTHLNNYANIFSLNESFMSDINQRAEKCGYFDFMEKALTFPPAGKFIAPNDSAPGLSTCTALPCISSRRF